MVEEEIYRGGGRGSDLHSLTQVLHHHWEYLASDSMWCCGMLAPVPYVRAAGTKAAEAAKRLLTLAKEHQHELFASNVDAFVTANIGDSDELILEAR